MKGKRSAEILGLGLITIWGISYLSIKVVVEEMNPILSAFYRFLLAAGIMLAILKWKCPGEKILKEDRLKIATGGLLGVAAYFILENYSILFTSASNVSVLIASIPVFTILSQRVFFKERMSPARMAGSILSIAGIVVVMASKNGLSLFSKGMLGDFMALGAALCWVLYSVVSRNLKGGYKSLTVTTYQIVWGCVFLSPSLLLETGRVPSPMVLANLAFLAVFCSAAGYVIYIHCLEKLGATAIAAFINLQPIVSIVSAALLLREEITAGQMIGSGIILLGVSMVTLIKDERRICT